MMELDKLKPTAASTIIVCAASFFSVLFMIFLLNPALFFRLDTLRLIVVGLGLTTPMLLVNLIFFRLGDTHKLAQKLMIGKEENEKMTWATAGIITVLIVAFISLISYTFRFSLSMAVWIIFWVEAALLVMRFIASTAEDNKPLQEKTKIPKPPDS